MLLSSDNSSFIISLPKNFLYKEVNDKYLHLLKRLSNPYQKIEDFLNATIQSCTFPGFNFETVEQITQENKTFYRGGFGAEMYSKRELTLTFKTVTGFINYFIMLDQFLLYFNHSTKEHHFNPLQLTILDDYGYNLATYHMTKPVLANISDLDISYSSDVPDFKQFTVGFKFSGIELVSEFSPNTVTNPGLTISKFNNF